MFSEEPTVNPDAMMTDEATAAQQAPDRKHAHRPLSKVLRQFSGTIDKDDVSIASLRDALGDRSFAALLVVFSSINLIPILPPGSTLVFGLPPLIIALQMIFGQESVWLPQILLVRTFPAARFRSLLRWVSPRLRMMERFIKPRWWPFPNTLADRGVGILCALLSALVILPLPGFNWLPAFAMVLMGLSLSQRDGMLLAIGGGIGLAMLAVLGAAFGTVTSFAHGFFH